jgi:hypothetical protein
MSNETYKTLIEAMVDERKADLQLNASAAFMAVVNELVMDQFDLSTDDIEAGSTDGGGDGQVDAMYVLINGVAAVESIEGLIPEKGPIELDITLVQSKFSDGFEENPLTIIRATINDLLTLANNYSSILPNYNEALQEKFSVARAALLATAGRTAKIKSHIFYACKGATTNIHSRVRNAGEQLSRDFGALCSATETEIKFYGAEELVAISREPKTRSRMLDIAQVFSSDTGDSYACLVTLRSLANFLSDEKGEIIRSMFDANVRDFLGKTEVNDAIKSTLTELSEGDFWWFNNGVTIVAANVDQKGKSLALEDPLLVNGLQTSSVIFEFLNGGQTDPELVKIREDLLALVKIVVPKSDKARDEIVKATNSQTHIPKPYLRGMDTVHRNIEDYLRGSGLFYERRKNQYKNQGRKRSSIVTLTEMAQALMSAFIFRSSDARGRPNSLLKSEDDYQRLFSEKYHLDTYRNIIDLKRKIVPALMLAYPDRSSAFRNDVLYHVITYISASQFRGLEHAAAGWREFVPTDDSVALAVEVVVNLFIEKGANDRLAKSPEFQRAVIAKAVELLQ